MKITEISAEEFEKETKADGRKSWGANKLLLKNVQDSGMPVVLEMEDDKRAVSKLTALYVARRSSNAQVRIVRRSTKIFVGPGTFVARASKKE